MQICRPVPVDPCLPCHHATSSDPGRDPATLRTCSTGCSSCGGTGTRGDVGGSRLDAAAAAAAGMGTPAARKVVAAGTAAGEGKSWGKRFAGTAAGTAAGRQEPVCAWCFARWCSSPSSSSWPQWCSCVLSAYLSYEQHQYYISRIVCME